MAFLPKPAGAPGGVIIGGASLWITDQGTADQQQGAWEFVKFVASPEIQAFFASNTGYYPTRKAAYDQQLMKDALAKYPQFQKAVDELRGTKASPPPRARCSAPSPAHDLWWKARWSSSCWEALPPPKTPSMPQPTKPTTTWTSTTLPSSRNYLSTNTAKGRPITEAAFC